MRVSRYYKLGRTQPTLDFVDVHIDKDSPLYIDPRALRLLPSAWGHECVALIKDFFSTVLRTIRDGDVDHATELLAELSEPNETHLGLSRGRSQGHAVAYGKAELVADALSKSEAVQSGLLKDLEETALMIDGIAYDIVSDIATNIIREPLIRYTQYACATYGIPLDEDVDSGPMWDPKDGTWYTEYAKLPLAKKTKLLLVPKAIIRRKLDFNHTEYFNHYILPFLQSQELMKNSSLVTLLKDGTPRVTKSILKETYGTGKDVSLKVTLESPDVLKRFRQNKKHRITGPPDHLELAALTNGDKPKWSKLLSDVTGCPRGTTAASRYHKAVEQLLSALFFPSLSHPEIEVEIHEGRKRIDITYVNGATGGFFAWLAAHYPSAHIFVECKNYSKDVANPELDQLSSRFSPSRGKVGFLVCRQFEDKELFIQRCRDTSNDDRGFILPFDDGDLGEMTAFMREDRREDFEGLLRTRFNRLIM